MFKLAKIVEDQNQKIMNLEGENDSLKIQNVGLNKKCLNLQGQIDDLIDNLKEIKSFLSINDYGNPQVKISKTLGYVTDKIKELDNETTID